jgi:hypothetical protein
LRGGFPPSEYYHDLFTYYILGKQMNWSKEEIDNAPPDLIDDLRALCEEINVYENEKISK